MIAVTEKDFEACAEYAAEIRHEIHRNPELGLELTETEALIVRELKSFGVREIYPRFGGEHVTGVVAVVRGNKPGRTIGFRADGDALPLNENSGCAWTSEKKAHMHACGHDGHTAMLLSVVRYLMQHNDFAGTFVAIFQPGEEGYAGARYMVEAGLMEKFGIEEVYALHCEPSIPVGSVGANTGYAMANADLFDIEFEGSGGHGSKPQNTLDPVVAACECVMALQTVVARNIDPNLSAVITVGSIQAGAIGHDIPVGSPAGTSVIPQTARLRGTVRSFEPEVQDKLESRMKKIAEGIADMYDMKVRFTYVRTYPALYNDPVLVAEGREIFENVLGKNRVEDFAKSGGAEDFSFMTKKRPGFLFRLGMKDETHNAATHNEAFDFNDKAFATGGAAVLSLMLNRMLLK